MKKPLYITFTGIDDRTDLFRANELAGKYPIEWGVLFSKSNKDSRYPSIQGIKEICENLESKSAHLCGSLARKLSDLDILDFEEISSLGLGHFDRIQN